MLYIILSLVLLVALGVFFFMQRPAFGRKPGKARKATYLQLENYNGGAFQNAEHTPPLAEGVTYTRVLRDFIFQKNPLKIPPSVLPSKKTSLHGLGQDENIFVWFGHSSYFMQVDGKRILIDPVFSGNASPLPNTMRSFPGADVYATEDIPEIDMLLLTHDHWDHLDHPTIMQLKPKIKHIYTGLGVGEHLEAWGFPANMITERNWHERIPLGDGFELITAPARHFSGRTFARNISLWLSFILITPNRRIYIGGDSGYGSHFKQIGQQYGPFDLVILECGQYNPNWRYIHMLPDEVVPAAKDLQARHLMIVHWAKFPLSSHNWNEPVIKVSAYAQEAQMPLATPMIGERVDLDDLHQNWDAWWLMPEAGS